MTNKKSTTAKNMEGPYGSPGFVLPLNEEWAAKRELARVTRNLLDAMVTTTADADTLVDVATRIAAQTERLAAAPRLEGRTKFMERAKANVKKMGSELNPLDGRSNPIASDFDIWIEGERVFGRVTMGWPYEGPPGCLHGGFVAALFDQFLGVGQSITGQVGFTGTLQVRYIKPTPLVTPLHFEGWVDNVHGRKSTLMATITANSEVTARCEGLFIAMREPL